MPKAKTKTLLQITPKGEQYYARLQKLGFPTLRFEQKAEFDILFDLAFEGENKLRLERLFQAGRRSALGHLLDEAPSLEEPYARILHGLIKQGYVKAIKVETG